MYKKRRFFLAQHYRSSDLRKPWQLKRARAFAENSRIWIHKSYGVRSCAASVQVKVRMTGARGRRRLSATAGGLCGPEGSPRLRLKIIEYVTSGNVTHYPHGTELTCRLAMGHTNRKHIHTHTHTHVHMHRHTTNANCSNRCVLSGTSVGTVERALKTVFRPLKQVFQTWWICLKSDKVKSKEGRGLTLSAVTFLKEFPSICSPNQKCLAFKNRANAVLYS